MLLLGWSLLSSTEHGPSGRPDYDLDCQGTRGGTNPLQNSEIFMVAGRVPRFEFAGVFQINLIHSCMSLLFASLLHGFG